MTKNQKEDSHITLPWDEKAVPTNVIRCPNPKCGNNGMDGSITGYSSQYGIHRKCLKCNHTWQGGIGVQIADFSEPLPLPNVERIRDPVTSSYTGAEFRDPNKNVEPDKEDK